MRCKHSNRLKTIFSVIDTQKLPYSLSIWGTKSARSTDLENNKDCNNVLFQPIIYYNFDPIKENKQGFYTHNFLSPV